MYVFIPKLNYITDVLFIKHFQQTSAAIARHSDLDYYPIYSNITSNIEWNILWKWKQQNEKKLYTHSHTRTNKTMIRGKYCGNIVVALTCARSRNSFWLGGSCGGNGD